MKLSALDIDVLTPGGEKPEPIPLPTGEFLLPINPLVFPADWSSQVEVTTRWQTDVTRAATSRRSHSIILSSRPSRTLRFRVTGLSREESHALLQSCLALTSRFGVPVPLYCDAAAIEAVAPVALGQVRIYGDFRWRRFFEGGRVAIMQPFGGTAAAQRSTVWMTILEVTPRQMLLSYSLLDIRSITTADQVVPCIDVELSKGTQGTALTDSIYQVDMQVTEIDGASTLPGLWPAPSPDNADAMSPLCQVLDGHPVFPIDLNWAEGVAVEATRDIGSDAAGRTQVQEPVGPAYQRFSMSVMGHNREACWRILRFFDACRGRARCFWLLHPTVPWTMISMPTTGSCLIQATGRREDLLAHFRDAAFVRQDKTLVRRRLLSVTDFGDAFQLNFAPLPDTNFVGVQPIHLCSFEDDAVTESWATDSVLPAVQLRAVEEPDYGDVVVSGGSLGFTPSKTDLLAIPGCTFLAKAGGPAYSVDGRDSLLWPARGSVVGDLLDMSRNGVYTVASGYPLRSMRRTGNAACTLCRFQNRRYNGGQPTILDPSFSMDFMLDTSVPSSWRQLWSSSGWTIFFSLTPEALATIGASNRTVFDVVDTAGRRVALFCDSAGQSGAARHRLLIDAVGTGGFYTPFTIPWEQSDTASTITLRFDRLANKVQAWVNGRQAFSSAAVSSLFSPNGFTTSSWLTGFNWNQSSTSSVLRQRFGKYGCFNAVASYDRPLSAAEIDSVHLYFSLLYGCPSDAVTIY